MDEDLWVRLCGLWWFYVFSVNRILCFIMGIWNYLEKNVDFCVVELDLKLKINWVIDERLYMMCGGFGYCVVFVVSYKIIFICDVCESIIL